MQGYFSEIARLKQHFSHYPMSRTLLTLLILSLFTSLLGVAQNGKETLSHKASVSAIKRYQKSFSSLLAGDCRSYPSCSQFARQAFSKQPFVRATLLTSDRLIRCGNDHSLPTVRISGLQYAYDPVDFELDVTSLRPASDTLLACMTESQLKTIRLFHQQDDPSLNAVYISQLLVNPISRACRDDLNVELSKSFRKLGEPDALIDSISFAHQRNHKNSSEELIKIYSEMGNYAGANMVAKNAFTQQSVTYKVTSVLNSDFGDEIVPFDASPVLKDYQKILDKTPKLASITGIIPGGGYFYCNQPESALSSIVLIGLFSGLAIEANKKEMPVLTGISIVFGTSFYLGSIFGPSRSIVRQRDNYRQRIVTKYLS